MPELRKISLVILLPILATLLAACNGSPGSGDGSFGGETSEQAAETTAERTTASDSGVSVPDGVVESYSVALEEIEEGGGEQEVGEYRVGYIVEAVEGWWAGEPEALEWGEPASGETNHIEILPFEAGTGLLVPEMDMELTVLDETGQEIESKPLEFYRGEFYHYAANLSLPESGSYTLRAELSPPEFLRQGSEGGEGKVFTEPVTVEFEDVQINPGGE